MNPEMRFTKFLRGSKIWEGKYLWNKESRARVFISLRIFVRKDKLRIEKRP